MNQTQVSENRLIKRLDNLIAQADAVLASHTPNPPSMIGFPTLDNGQFQRWRASSESIIKAICGLNSSYEMSFNKETKRGAYKNCVDSGKGILVALKDDIEAGIIGDFLSSSDAGTVSFATIEGRMVSIQLSAPVYDHVKSYLDREDYFHAVEESYKVVREKLLEITGKEKATDVFNMNAENNKYHEVIFGKTARPGSTGSDFFRGVGYLNLAVQFLRNEKSHSLATTVDKNLALHYISLASLAHDLISKGDKK